MIRHHSIRQLQGYTLVEVMISVAIAGLLLASMARLVHGVGQTVSETDVQLSLQQELNFALDRMVRAVESARIGFIPLGENPATAYSESVRHVLAVSMAPDLDRNHDGWSDANNDQDWMDFNNDGIRDVDEPERIDEDPGHDMTNDLVAGVFGVDDDGDGQIDELMEFDDPLKSHEDDDEDGYKNDDNTNGFDDDNDGSVDEDNKQEINDDHKPGLAGFDDNFDGIIDNHPLYPNGDGDSKEAKRDDDEDGVWNEDGPEVVLYYLGATEVYAGSTNGVVDGAPLGDAGTLYERLAEPQAALGTDVTHRVIAENVSLFEVRRIAATPGDVSPLFEITLSVFDASGRSLSLTRTARLGARL